MTTCSRLRSLVGVPAPVALADVIPIGATGDADGEAAHADRTYFVSLGK